MRTKSDTARIEAKRQQAVEKIREIAPHADMILGILDETKIDLLLIALAGARLEAPES